MRYRFTDLPTLAAHAKAAGVPAMTLAGAGCARIHASAAAGPKAPVNEAFR